MGAAPLPGALGFVGSQRVGVLPGPDCISRLALHRTAVTCAWLRTRPRSPWGGHSALFLPPQPSRRLCSVA